MVNYLNILEVWDIVEKGYIAKYNSTTNVLTTESLLDKMANDNAVNAILNSVSEGVALLFGNMTTAQEMWNTLITIYEGNSQIKKTKITGHETKFENFRLEDGEIIENMYNRLIHIQNKFSELRETLSNEKVIGKLLRVMLRKPKWEGYVSALEAMQRVQATFTPDEMYAHLRSFKETLKQAGEPVHESKAIACSTQNIKPHNHSSTSNSQFTTSDSFIQKLDHESSKDAFLLSKMFQGMLSFEWKYKKEREEDNKKVV
jgi:gag-polypeptide of LTR copia-type